MHTIYILKRLLASEKSIQLSLILCNNFIDTSGLQRSYVLGQVLLRIIEASLKQIIIFIDSSFNRCLFSFYRGSVKDKTTNWGYLGVGVEFGVLLFLVFRFADLEIGSHDIGYTPYTAILVARFGANLNTAIYHIIMFALNAKACQIGKP